MTRLSEAVEAAYKVFAYAVHPDDEQSCRDELEEVLAPFVSQLPGEPEPEHDTHGLSEGDVVRFPRPGKVRPDRGHIVGVNSDGSMRVHNERTKMERAIMPADLEKLIVGPRGGERWVPVVEP